MAAAMNRVLVPGMTLLLLGAIPACGGSSSSGNPATTPAQRSDAELIFAQRAGELPAPKGPCPERSAPDVLGDPRAPVTRTAFGLAYCRLHDAPAGRTPTATDTVQVHYSGWTPEGRLFDSSQERGPTEFPVNQVIAGWTEALQLMTPGDKLRVWVPADLAYGKKVGNASDENPPKGPLIFEIELLQIVEQ